MCPLLFQEACYLEIITIGFYWGASSFPILLLLSPTCPNGFTGFSQQWFTLQLFIHLHYHFPFYPTLSGFWVFTHTDHNHTSVTFSHSYTFIPLPHRVWVLCYGLSYSHSLFLFLFILDLPVSPTGFTGFFIGFWFMIHHSYLCHILIFMVDSIIMMRVNQTSRGDIGFVLMYFCFSILSLF